MIALSAGAGAVTAAPSGSSAGPAPPQHVRTLRVTGTLRDGGTVTATGLDWRPGHLPKGDRLLSFTVAYYWRSCGRRCRTAADSTATPFAAARYVVAHADTGRRLRLTETATEVVETDPATFSFVAISASESVNSTRAVAAYGEVEYSADGYVCDPGQNCKRPHPSARSAVPSTRPATAFPR